MFMERSRAAVGEVKRGGITGSAPNPGSCLYRGSMEGSAGGGKDKTGVGNGQGGDAKSCSACKVEMQPWNFWRKYGAKQFQVDGRAMDVVWDLRAARLSNEPEPVSHYYVAVVSDEEVVLLLGNQKKEAFRRTGSRPSLSLQDAAQLVCKKEHVSSKKRCPLRQPCRRRPPIPQNRRAPTAPLLCSARTGRLKPLSTLS